MAWYSNYLISANQLMNSDINCSIMYVQGRTAVCRKCKLTLYPALIYKPGKVGKSSGGSRQFVNVENGIDCTESGVVNRRPTAHCCPGATWQVYLAMTVPENFNLKSHSFINAIHLLYILFLGLTQYGRLSGFGAKIGNNKRVFHGNERRHTPKQVNDLQQAWWFPA